MSTTTTTTASAALLVERRRAWKTPFTEAMGIRLPLVSAPMAGVSGGLLASEVTRAGGLGMISAGHLRNLADLEAQIEIFVESTNAAKAKAAIAIAMEDSDNRSSSSPSSPSSPATSDLAIGFIGFSSLATPTGWEDYEYILRKYRPKAVQFFAPFLVERPGRCGGGGGGTEDNVQLARAHGSKFIAQVCSMSDVRLAVRHGGVDAIICQGGEAGGHGLRRELGNSAMALASQAKRMMTATSSSSSSSSIIPVLASGGVVNGRHVASALCYCDGVSMGTRYWACRESIGDGRMQRRLVDDGDGSSSSCDGVLRTVVFDAIHNETSSDVKWPYPYDSVGALRNETTTEWDGRPYSELRKAMDETDLLERYGKCKEIPDASVVQVLAGEGVEEIDIIEGAYDITLRIEQEAIDAIDRLRSLCM